MNKFNNKFLGYYQIISGVFGLISIFIVYIFTSNSLPLTKLIFQILLFAGLYLITILSGIFILKKLKICTLLLYISLVPQIIKFHLNKTGFIFTSGSELSFYFTDKLEVDFAIFKVKFEMTLNLLENNFISLNIIPVILLIIWYSNNE